MTGKHETSGALAAFEQHLDVYGANQERWPEVTRAKFQDLLATDLRARTLLAEARALDGVLSRAPVVDAARMAALTDRIVATVGAEARERSAGSVVVLSPARRARSARMSAPRFGSAGWRVAASLAASLVIGIYLGTAPTVMSAVETVAASVGMTNASDDDTIALFDDTSLNGDEDLL